jgi:ribosomal protein S18 acetylase RimI-like enzyme
MGVRIEPMTLSDLADVLADHDQFWGGRDTRFLHQRVFVQEFGDTCLTARADGDAFHDRGASGAISAPDAPRSWNRIAGYLLGFTTPRRIGYIHAVAVRDDARGTGCGQALYRAFGAVAAALGAEQLKAVTTMTNAGSIAFHCRLGFDVRQVDDYSGPGVPRMVMTRPLPL